MAFHKIRLHGLFVFEFFQKLVAHFIELIGTVQDSLVVLVQLLFVFFRTVFARSADLDQLLIAVFHQIAKETQMAF